ncbi:DNA cytosine methyltransferase [Pseudonocardia broussonetiae]|uniref:DNA (cytosine-5-)-methyltransferase n=1 Tax=Pseudonocardia broussonetiae TaxID=2736640 RepID=A0A6M6JJ57_9PSEU|nr:DNA cytosine methyltransferase [Pseudonocardia broussonetiae]QJY46672.1 DNA cytosine methyltransferase [Pseudonocardia broussonetiae]
MTTATDLFAGAGGSSEGLTQAGVRVEVAANHWQLAVDTHAANHPDTEHRIANLSEVDWRTFPSTDIAWVSPSCVWHTRSGGRRRQLSADAERSRTDAGAVDRATAFAVIAAAEVHAYPVVLVENVVEFRDWVLYDWWLAGLTAIGYRVRELVLDAVDFGHAQHRRRLFVVATRDGVELDLTPPARLPVTAAEILDPHPGQPVTRRLYVADQIDSITDSGVPHLVTYRKHARARRADQHALATVTAGGNHHAVAQLVDGVQHHRMLSNRECARAQGFGDHYQFRGTAEQVKRQIGNAVPVGIARWLGERATAALGADAALGGAA